MKLTCDLCGGSLQMNTDGQGAVCTVCGLTYSMERLKVMLNVQPSDKNEITIGVDEKKDTPTPVKEAPFVPKQFIMNCAIGSGDVSGQVQQGGIGLGEKVYINEDYSHPYTIYSVNDDVDVSSVKQGMKADLFLDACPRKILKSASVVTGEPNPVANAYNFSGTVRDYFAHLLRCELAEYEIRANVPHDALTIPVDFVLMKAGKPVLAIFLINSNDSKGRWQIKKAERRLSPQGTSVVHFFDNYRNDKPYVIERIRKAMSLSQGEISKEVWNNVEKKDSTVQGSGSPSAVPVTDPDFAVLDVISVKKRPFMAYDLVKCRVRKGYLDDTAYVVAVNSESGPTYSMGKIKPFGKVFVGFEATILVYCPREMLPTLKTLYASPQNESEYPDGR